MWCGGIFGTKWHRFHYCCNLWWVQPIYGINTLDYSYGSRTNFTLEVSPDYAKYPRLLGMTSSGQQRRHTRAVICIVYADGQQRRHYTGCHLHCVCWWPTKKALHGLSSALCVLMANKEGTTRAVICIVCADGLESGHLFAQWWTGSDSISMYPGPLL